MGNYMDSHREQPPSEDVQDLTKNGHDNGARQAMDDLISQVKELHSSPTVALKIFKLLKDPDFEMEELKKCLEADPALAAAILRLVNSSRFGLSRT
ncbi:MAG: HDOD domain-containing protein, partial [bacterium]|nr:HDOD domain-containing protein [bacterium]